MKIAEYRNKKTGRRDNTKRITITPMVDELKEALPIDDKDLSSPTKVN